MSPLIKIFWISLVGLSFVGIITLGFVGIPAKPVVINKTISNDRLP